VQFGTGNDVPHRDPSSITIEGSNDPNALQSGNSSFALIWQGPTSLLTDQAGPHWVRITASSIRRHTELSRACDRCCGGDGGGRIFRDEVVWALITAPAIPTGLTATAGDSQATLNWAAASGAAGYSVKRSTVSGGSYTTVGNPIGTNYVDTG